MSRSSCLPVWRSFPGSARTVWVKMAARWSGRAVISCEHVPRPALLLRRQPPRLGGGVCGPCGVGGSLRALRPGEESLLRWVEEEEFTCGAGRAPPGPAESRINTCFRSGFLRTALLTRQNAAVRTRLSLSKTPKHQHPAHVRTRGNGA